MTTYFYRVERNYLAEIASLKSEQEIVTWFLSMQEKDKALFYKQFFDKFKVLQEAVTNLIEVFVEFSDEFTKIISDSGEEACKW